MLKYLQDWSLSSTIALMCYYTSYSCKISSGESWTNTSNCDSLLSNREWAAR